LLNSVLYGVVKFNLVQIQISNIIWTFIIALVISFIAALLPSRSAAKLDPIESLAAD
jgi:ABC-type antimicrobial peptide transport system permease subunit